MDYKYGKVWDQFRSVYEAIFALYICNIVSHFTY